MYTAIIAFGSNLENPTQQVLQAAQRVAQQPEIIQFILSPLYRTTPVGYTDQPDFINAVAQVQTMYRQQLCWCCCKTLKMSLGVSARFAMRRAR